MRVARRKLTGPCIRARKLSSLYRFVYTNLHIWVVGKCDPRNICTDMTMLFGFAARLIQSHLLATPFARILSYISTCLLCHHIQYQSANEQKYSHRMHAKTTYPSGNGFALLHRSLVCPFWFTHRHDTFAKKTPSRRFITTPTSLSAHPTPSPYAYLLIEGSKIFDLYTNSRLIVICIYLRGEKICSLIIKKSQ